MMRTHHSCLLTPLHQPPKCVQWTAQSLSFVEIQNLQDERVAKDAHEAHLFAETIRRAVEDKLHVEKVLGSVMATGSGSLFALMDKLLNICDQQLFAHSVVMYPIHIIC
jgi:hypothetical protein